MIETEERLSQYQKADRLAKLGLHVFPVRVAADGRGAFSKRPFVAWTTAATTDTEQITDWWLGAYADAAIGVHVGKSGLIVCDGDQHPGALNTLDVMLDAGLPSTWTNTSSSGTGLHFVYAAPEGEYRKHEDPGFEVKAGNNFVVWSDDRFPEGRESFTPAPVVLLKPAQRAASEPVRGDLAQWIQEHPGKPEGALKAAIDALPPYGDGRWNNANLTALARPLVTKANVFPGGGEAARIFVDRYAAGDWNNDECRRDAMRAFGAAITYVDPFDDWIASLPMVAPKGSTVVTGEEYAIEPPSEPGERSFKILSRSDLRNRPRPEWLVSRWLQESGVTMLAGEPGIGKTFLALDWACSIATGEPWDGEYVKQGKVLYVAAEGIDFFEQRISAWEAANSCKVFDDNLEYVEEGFSLSSEKAIGDMCDYIQECNYALVILDTFAQLSDLESENDNSQVSAVLKAATRIRKSRPGTAVLIIHHLGKAGTVRGASAIHGAVDTLVVARNRDNGTFALSTRRSDGGKVKNSLESFEEGYYLRQGHGSAVIDRDAGVNLVPLDLAITKVGGNGEWFKAGEILESLGWENEAEVRRVQRKLHDLVEEGRLTAEGGKKARQYRIVT